MFVYNSGAGYDVLLLGVGVGGGFDLSPKIRLKLSAKVLGSTL